MWMLSTAPPVLSACAFMRLTSSMIVASFPARVHGTNRLRGAVIFQSGRRSAPSSRKTLSSTSDYTYPERVSARARCAGCARRAHVFLWVGAIQVEWLLESNGRVCDEAWNAQVVLRRRVRLGRRQSPTFARGRRRIHTMKGCRRITSPASPVSYVRHPRQLCLRWCHVEGYAPRRIDCMFGSSR